MRATRGDPEDVTRERLPYILEQVKRAAGEYAAGIVRAESEKALEEARTAHAEELEVIRRQAKSAVDANSAEADAVRQKLLQAELDSQALAERNAVLQQSLTAAAQAEEDRRKVILQTAFIEGAKTYSALRWFSAIGFGILSGVAAWLSSIQPNLSVCVTVLISVTGFWFVPEILEKPLHAAAMRRLRAVVAVKDASVVIPLIRPDFQQRHWTFDLDSSEPTEPSKH
jgi:hypothetical protein